MKRVFPRWSLSVCLVGLVVGAVTVAATAPTSATEPSQRDQVMKFLKDHVVGKPVINSSVSKIDGDRIEAEFSGRGTVTNLVETETGLMFDLVAEVRQTNYDLDSEGKRRLPGRNEDRTSVSRTQLGLRRSTGQLLGFCHGVSGTSTNGSGSASLVRAKVEKGALVIESSTMGYNDYFAAEGKHYPGASTDVVRYVVVDGKLERHQESKGFEVDPVTLQRSALKDTDSMVFKQEP